MNLATFCQTWEEPAVHQLMDLAIDKNMIDKDEYPQTAELERRCVHMLADLWNAPESANTVGASAIGSSEACMLGGMAAKWRWRAKRAAAGQPADRPNMVCGPVQVVWHKFAKYWDIEMREVPMSPGHYAMDVDDMLARVDENTIMVVPTFGVTYTGAYEFVKPLADALDTLEADTGLDVDIHVDGASGAFLAPFCAPDIEWDFRLPRVKSISTSGHKFGLAPLGVGWVVWRDTAELPDDLIFHVSYLGGDMPVFQINFSRPAGQIAAQYYDFVRLGRDGYRRVHMASYDTGRFLAEEIEKLGPFELICDSNPQTGIPAVAWKLADGADPGYTLYDLADRLRIRGWQVPAYPLTGAVSDVAVQRILVRQGVSRDLAAILLDDMRNAVDHFTKHPVTVSMTSEEASGFSLGPLAVGERRAAFHPGWGTTAAAWAGDDRRVFGALLAVDPVPWARAQMAFTLAFHIILVPLGVSWAFMALIANYRGIKHGDADALGLAQRWSKYMAVTFAVGAVTGTVLSLRVRAAVAAVHGPVGRGLRHPVRLRGPVLLHRGDLHRHLHLRLAAPESVGPLLDGRAGRPHRHPRQRLGGRRQRLDELTGGLHARQLRRGRRRRSVGRHLQRRDAADGRPHGARRVRRRGLPRRLRVRVRDAARSP